MFDHVGDVDLPAFDAGRRKSSVQQRPRGSHERPPLAILLITWLFTNDDHPGSLGALAEHGLGCMFVQLTSSAVLRVFAKLFDGSPIGRREARRRRFRYTMFDASSASF
jgi:hypothetical protein